MKKLFQTAGGLAAALLALCLALSGSAPAKAMDESQKGGDSTVILVVLQPGRTDTPIDLFLNAYGGTVLSERTVIAPGTENAVSVRFSDPNGVPFSYKVYLKAEVLRGGAPSDIDLPLMILTEGGEYRPFSDWATEDEGLLVKQGSLSAGKQGSLDFSWKWDFERGDDAGDVALSTLSDLSAIVRIIVITEAEEPAPPETTEEPTTEEPTTTEAPTTEAPTTEEPTTEESTTTEEPTEATTEAPTDPPTEKPTDPPTTAPTKPPKTSEPTTPAPTRPPWNPDEPKPFGVDDSPIGIIVILILAAVAGVLLIIIAKKNKKKGTRNE